LDAGIIRKLEVRSAVSNAIAFMKSRKNLAVFKIHLGIYKWNHYQQPKTLKEFRHYPLSDTISTDLKKRGFKFVGSTVVYAPASDRFNQRPC
jgi:DNA-3-methyladenine glycosylase I